MRRKVVVAILILIGMLGVVALAGDNPDWTLPVSIRAQEIENLSVDIAAQSIDHVDIWFTGQTTDMNVNITNSQIDVNVTNSTITIEPAEGTVFEIKPASGVTFNITGDVNATIQGTASVSIDNATITVDVATIREKASEENKVGFASKGGFVDDGDSKSVTVFENTLGQTVYIEMLTFSVWKYNVTDPTLYPLDFRIDFGFYYSDGTEFAWIYSNPGQNVINLDPAIPLPSGGYIVFYIKNQGNAPAEFESSVVYRKP